jgi:hypothetical protein
MNINFNSDTSTNYAYHRLEGIWDSGSGSRVVTFGASSDTTMQFVRITADNGTPSNIYGVGIIDILDYASTSKNKTVRALSGGDQNGDGGGQGISLNSGLWMSTSAITQIDFTTTGAGNYDSSTKFALYGIKG